MSNKPSYRIAAHRLATQYTVVIFLITLASCAQAASYRVDVFALSRTAGMFEAYVDTRQLSPPLDVLSVKLQIQCRLHDGQISRIWVPFTDRLLSRGSLFVKTIDLPPPCVAWERLVDAKVPLALGKGDSQDAQVSVGQGAIQGSSILLRPSRNEPAARPVRSNQVIGLQVLSEHRDLLVVEIDYYYSGNWGAAGWLSAEAKNTLEPNRNFTFYDTQGCANNNAAKIGRQSMCMRLLTVTPNVKSRTNAIKICLFNGNGPDIKCETFPYVKQWN